MKTSLSHLPESKQTELQKLTSTIRSNCSDVEKIILFGSYARGDYKELKDLKTDRKSGHVSDYDILVITSKKQVALDVVLWSKISDELQKLGLTAYPKILTHDIEELNNKLAKSQYFYSDIKKEGIALYDSKKFEFAEKRILTGQERKEIAREYFEHWFGSATEFFIDYNNALNRDSYKKAAFELHQAAEHAYKSLILVFTNYNPNEHFLRILKKECDQYFPDLRNIFLQDSEAEKTRFELLDYAYIGGRYDPKYFISKEDLEILAKDVKQLLEITEILCEEKIESFKEEVKNNQQSSY